MRPRLSLRISVLLALSFSSAFVACGSNQPVGTDTQTAGFGALGAMAGTTATAHGGSGGPADDGGQGGAVLPQAGTSAGGSSAAGSSSDAGGSGQGASAGTSAQAGSAG